jgi:hypothetical protein
MQTSQTQFRATGAIDGGNGTSLHKLQGAHPSDPAALAPVLTSVLRGLTRVHEAGLKHQQLTPETIGLGTGGEAIIDLLAPENAESTMAICVPKYSAPEAFHPEAAFSDCARLDSYVLGFIFYELFVGRDLFEQIFTGLGDEGSAAWFAWHADGNKRPPALATLLAGFPQPVSEAIDGMMAKDPAGRLCDFGRINRMLDCAAATVILPVVGGTATVAKDVPEVRPAARLSEDSPAGNSPALEVRAPPPRPPASRGRVGSLLVAAALLVTGILALEGRHRAPAARPPRAIRTATGIMLLASDGEKDAFYIDAKAVTNRDYDHFREATGLEFPAAGPKQTRRPEEPVTALTWYEARSFADWAGKRLPTASEIERAVQDQGRPRWITKESQDAPPGALLRCAAGLDILRSRHLLGVVSDQ